MGYPVAGNVAGTSTGYGHVAGVSNMGHVAGVSNMGPVAGESTCSNVAGVAHHETVAGMGAAAFVLVLFILLVIILRAL